LACRFPFVEGALHINHDQRRARRWESIHARIITKDGGEAANKQVVNRRAAAKGPKSLTPEGVSYINQRRGSAGKSACATKTEADIETRAGVFV
jgi:hypothetical protein